MPTNSRNKSKREQLEKSAARIRAAFGTRKAVEAAQRTDGESQLRQAWQLATEITAFAEKYLRHFMTDPKTGEFIPAADFHHQLYSWLLTEQFAAIAAPREHAKSTVVDVIFVLYCVCFKLRCFIVLISDTQGQAALQLAAVKEELENNQELRADFGNLVGEKKWDVNDIRTTTNVTVVARGAGQSLRGLRFRMNRPDLVICDDMENEEDSANPETREKLMRWFKGTVMNLGKYCQVFVIGTIIHYDGLLSTLLDPEKHTEFKKLRLMAVDQDWTPGSVLWPAKWSLADLRKKDAQLGTVIFNQEWRNLPVAADQQIFVESWITQHAYTKAELLQTPLTKVTYYDPAISQKKQADDFAGVTLGIDPTGHLLVLWAEGKKIPYLQQKQYILDHADIDRPAVIGIEDVAYQSALKQEMEEAMRTTRRYVPVVGITNLSDKLLRISTLSPLVENGTIRFLLDGSQAKLISQLLFLGKIKDDLADALQGAVNLARQHNFTPAFAVADVTIGGRDPNNSSIGSRRWMETRVGHRANDADNWVQRDRKSVWR